MLDPILCAVVFGVVGLVTLNALSYYSQRWMILPDVVWVLLLGVIYGSLDLWWNVPPLNLSSELILYAFVPLLIFASTQKICLGHLRKVLTPAAILASLGILISMSIIGTTFHFLFQIPWLEALLFGAIISATDPLAVGALIQQNKVLSTSQKLLIEGESILNDGFVVTLFGFLSIILFSTETFSAAKSGGLFVLHIFGALALGASLGFGARWLLKTWHEEHFTLTTNITLALAFGSFLLAEQLEFSGILAVFAAALAYGFNPEKDSHNKHTQQHLWDYFEYLANAVLFFLLGASFFHQASFETLSISLVMVALIMLFVSRLGAIMCLFPILRVENKPLSHKDFWLLNFSGARGAVSVALILLLPNSFELKPLFLSLAFVMILFSLVVYPLIIHRLLQD